LRLALFDSIDDELVCDVTLQRPLVAIGAPANAYLPRTAERLHAEVTIPRHAEVANAVGAVVGSVVQRLEVLISPLDGGSRFRVHLPDGIRDFADLEKAVCYAQKTLPPQVKMLARSAGADQTEVKMQRKDRMGTSDLGWIQEIHLDTKLVFTAVGRPRQAKRVLK
jgi:N-methylhydantoinase A/oxoprolinase/acetone carboxylase beta subunit